jgi:acetaldehyde dehydrogenase (acetylating)
MEDNVYEAYLDYESFINEPEIAQLIDEFKQDVQTYVCGFRVKSFTSKNILGSTDLVLVPEFANLLRQQLSSSVIEGEIKKLTLVNNSARA